MAVIVRVIKDESQKPVRKKKKPEQFWPIKKHKIEATADTLAQNFPDSRKSPVFIKLATMFHPYVLDDPLLSGINKTLQESICATMRQQGHDDNMIGEIKKRGFLFLETQENTNLFVRAILKDLIMGDKK